MVSCTNAIVDRWNTLSETPFCKGLGKVIDVAKKVVKVIAILALSIAFAIFQPVVFGVSTLIGLAFPHFTMNLLDRIKNLFFMNVLTVAIGVAAGVLLLPFTLIAGTVLSGAYIGAKLYDFIPENRSQPLLAVSVEN